MTDEKEFCRYCGEEWTEIRTVLFPDGLCAHCGASKLTAKTNVKGK